MARSCPSCGADADFSVEAVELLRSHCASCGGSFTIVREREGAAGAPAASGDRVPAGATPPVEGEVPGIPGFELACASCGEPMFVTVASPTMIEARCTGCDAELKFVASTGRERPMREERGGRGRPSAPMGAARPCRECGGPLSFSTEADGTVVGSCASCGNRFSLPARREPRDGDRGGYGRGGGFGRGGPGRRPSYGAGRGRFDRGAGRSDRGPPGRFGPRRDAGQGAPFRRFDRRERRSDDDDDDRRDRRRRPRRD
jgi:putative hemolysin